MSGRQKSPPFCTIRTAAALFLIFSLHAKLQLPNKSHIDDGSLHTCHKSLNSLRKRNDRTHVSKKKKGLEGVGRAGGINTERFLTPCLRSEEIQFINKNHACP
jgi:hypothetical protein